MQHHGHGDGARQRREHVWHTCGKMCSLYVAKSYSVDATACVCRIYVTIMHLRARACVTPMSSRMSRAYNMHGLGMLGMTTSVVIREGLARRCAIGVVLQERGT